MQIEIFGYFIIPLGIVLLFFDKKWLLYMTAIFAGFTATSILRIGGDLSVQPSYYLGMLFIIKQLIDIIKTRKIELPDKRLLIFVGICLASLIMPNLVQNAGVEVISQEGKFELVRFTSKNITQMMYLLYCFTLYIFTKDYLKDKKEEKELLLKFIIYGCVIVCFLAIYQQIAYNLDLEFDAVFRSNPNGNVQTMGGNLRLYSTTIEPSMLAYYLVAVLALVITIKRDIIKYKYPIILLIMVIGILTTSSTFLFGLFVLGAITVFNTIFQKDKDLRRRNIHVLKRVLILGIIALVVILITNVVKPNIIKGTITSTIDKVNQENTSGQERSQALIQHTKIGLKYPLLGVGFGTARSKDLFSTWLCNTGVLGLGVFIWYLISLANKLRKTNSYIAYGISNYLIVLFACAFISVPEPYNLFIWLMFALGENMIDEPVKEGKEKVIEEI